MEETTSNEAASGDAGRFSVRATSTDHFSWLRTRLAVERTIMASVRTAMSLIGFGFTIVQFFDRLQQMPGTRPAAYPEAPRYLGLSLIASGVLLLVITLWQYRFTLLYLWSADYAPIAGMTKEGKNSPIIAVAVILTLVGLSAFFAVLMRFD